MRARDTKESRNLSLNRSITVELENRHEQKAKSQVGSFRKCLSKISGNKGLYWGEYEGGLQKKTYNNGRGKLLKGCLYLMFAYLWGFRWVDGLLCLALVVLFQRVEKQDIWISVMKRKNLKHVN